MRETSISDQKRLVRAEHWRHARGFLRARDKVHHRDWKLLTVAGPVPHEEIGCIRELMPRAHIVSIDIEAANIEAAIEAGADEVFHSDLGVQKKIDYKEWANGQVSELSYYSPPECLERYQYNTAQGQFDAICLDLTGPADDWLRRVVQVYFTKLLISRGVLIVTFSYGRDVVEVYQAEWHVAIHTEYSWSKRLLGKMPEMIAARVWYALGSRTQYLDSCMQYRGGMMPMVSCLLVKGPKPPIVRFSAVESGDYELAVTAEDAGNTFACPADRLEELRARYGRRLTAQKAVETRRLREAKRLQQPQLRLIQGPKHGPTCDCLSCKLKRSKEEEEDNPLTLHTPNGDIALEVLNEMNDYTKHGIIKIGKELPDKCRYCESLAVHVPKDTRRPVFMFTCPALNKKIYPLHEDCAVRFFRPPSIEEAG